MKLSINLSLTGFICARSNSNFHWSDFVFILKRMACYAFWEVEALYLCQILSQFKCTWILWRISRRWKHGPKQSAKQNRKRKPPATTNTKLFSVITPIAKNHRNRKGENPNWPLRHTEGNWNYSHFILTFNRRVQLREKDENVLELFSVWNSERKL